MFVQLCNVKLCKPGAWLCCRAPRCQGWCRPRRRWRASRCRWAHGHGCNIPLPGPLTLEPTYCGLQAVLESTELRCVLSPLKTKFLDKLYHKALCTLMLLLSQQQLCFYLFYRCMFARGILWTLNMEDVCLLWSWLGVHSLTDVITLGPRRRRPWLDNSQQKIFRGLRKLTGSLTAGTSYQISVTWSESGGKIPSSCHAECSYLRWLIDMSKGNVSDFLYLF